jgi:signal transduction histidine kinase
MKIICLISLVILSLFVAAQKVDKQITVISKYAIDSNSVWTVNNISKKKLISFNQSDIIDIGYNKNVAIWCSFKIKNLNKVKALKLWLCFNNNHIDSLSFFNGDDIKTIGDRTINKSPFIETLAFEIELKPNEERIYFTRIKKTTSYLDFTYSINNSDTLESLSSKKTTWVAFLIGMVFLLLMINLMLFFLTKNRLYFYYIIYSLLTLIYVSITTNFAKHVVLPQFLFFSETRVYSGALWYIALSYFLSCFLQLKVNQPKIYKFLFILNGINFSLIIISILFLIFNSEVDFRLFFTFGYIVFLVAIFTLFLAAIFHLKIDRTIGIYALVAFAPQLVWGATLILKTFQIIPVSMGGDWMLFLSLYEVFLFGYILSKNYIQVFVNNNQLMKAVILEKESSLRAISEVQLRERRNIANIIHDNLGSKIAHIIHLFDIKKTTLAKETINDLAENIRGISHTILPKALDEGALASSLKSQIRSLNMGFGNKKVELFSYDFPEKIDEPWVYDLYLISLEIINNAIKHGRANLVTIELYKYDANYLFQYTDDGIGFNMLETSKGFGLENIEKRIIYHKGTFDINSVKNEGTTIQINIPVSK